MPRLTQPISTDVFTQELTQTRLAGEDAQHVGESEAQQDIGQNDVFDAFHRKVVRPLREHLPALARRNTTQLLREGVDPAQLRELPPDVLHEAASWAQATPHKSELTVDLLDAERSVQSQREKTADYAHSVLASVNETLRHAQAGAADRLDALEARGELTAATQAPIVAEATAIAQAQFSRLLALLPVVDAMVNTRVDPQGSAPSKTEGFFLATVSAIRTIARRNELATTPEGQQGLGDIIRFALRQPLNKR